MSDIFIIAEVGINHNGDINLAKQMIDEAKNAGVDCVKFQTFKAEEFVSDPKQTYTYFSEGKEITESMLEMFKRYQFSKSEWIEIVKYCEEMGIVFSSTAQNPSDLDFLLSITQLPFIKVGSDDLTNLELMKYYASKKIPMIISAGMAYSYEIEDALRTIRDSGNTDVTLLHCISSYPTSAEDVNLKKIPVIHSAFDVKVGFSDHTIGSAAAIGAVCMGATVIEKHFTLSNEMAGPDHWFSINPQELKRYADDIRFISKALGSSELKPTDKELEMRSVMQRQIVYSRDLKKAEILSRDSFEFKRAEGDGIKPKHVEFLLKRKLKNSVHKGQIVLLEDLV